MKSKINLSNAWAYLVGNYRYKLYYRFPTLLRTHIREQIEYRINSMDRECYNEGQCKMCGCSTTALQMASKSCEGECYPEMMSYRTWSTLKLLSTYTTTSWMNVRGTDWRINGKYFIKR